jgi:hypothetical protein
MNVLGLIGSKNKLSQSIPTVSTAGVDLTTVMWSLTAAGLLSLLLSKLIEYGAPV